MFPIFQLKRTLGVVLAALLLAVSACGGSDDESSTDSSSSESSSESSSSESSSEDAQSSGEPNLDDVPDVVAEVNGEEIGKDEFEAAYTPQYQQMAMQSQASGGKVDEGKLRQQVVDNLVNTELLTQEADNRGIEVSEKKADSTLMALAQQNGMKTSDEFVKALEKQGMDKDMIESQVEDQVQIEALLAEESGGSQVTEAKLRALYDDIKAQQKQAGKAGQKVPPFEKVKPQLEQQLQQQEQSKAAGALIKKLREDADIETHV